MLLGHIPVFLWVLSAKFTDAFIVSRSLVSSGLKDKDGFVPTYGMVKTVQVSTLRMVRQYRVKCHTQSSGMQPT